MRRGLVPALLVNAVFFAGVALSLHWRGADPGGDVATRADATRPDAGSETRTMGAAPAMAPPPATPNERAPQVTQPQPQLQTPGPPQSQSQPQPQPQPQRQPVTQAAPAAAPPVGTATQGRPGPRVEPPARTESRPKRQAAENSQSVTRQATGVAVQPSFDCAKARSRAERIICGDRELAQLDRDTGRLHARAKAAARDQAAFKRQNDREWKQREEVCRDKACLLAWYAHRREQLQETVAQAR
jgi:outer membrane biosynthesis protein TonB